MSLFAYFIFDDSTKAVSSTGRVLSSDDVTVPAGQTLVELGGDEIPSVNSIYDPETGTFTLPSASLADAKAQKIGALSQICANFIRAGFTSGALGADHQYPAADTDQANMQRVASVGGSLWCFASGAWTFEAHTAVEGATVLQDFGTACDAARVHLSSLSTTVNAAATIDDVNAISW